MTTRSRPTTTSKDTVGTSTSSGTRSGCRFGRSKAANNDTTKTPSYPRRERAGFWKRYPSAPPPPQWRPQSARPTGGRRAESSRRDIWGSGPPQHGKCAAGRTAVHPLRWEDRSTRPDQIMETEWIEYLGWKKENILVFEEWKWIPVYNVIYVAFYVAFMLTLCHINVLIIVRSGFVWKMWLRFLNDDLECADYVVLNCSWKLPIIPVSSGCMITVNGSCDRALWMQFRWWLWVSIVIRSWHLWIEVVFRDSEWVFWLRVGLW